MLIVAEPSHNRAKKRIGFASSCGTLYDCQLFVFIKRFVYTLSNLKLKRIRLLWKVFFDWFWRHKSIIAIN